ncbi:MAG: hypothetical protein HQK57_16520 [Deltaproteobacteria bacterium]|nr:hypothetical protein [Deltaproteobacteria bacterium]MBF0510511.1 hypothetical protein [Deltaproteobacteria bacterium]MBF0525222.1 hypothetical protein [Deltaproteobacteria bacterium]
MSQENESKLIQDTVEQSIVFLSDIISKLFSCLQTLEGLGNVEAFKDRISDHYSKFKYPSPNEDMPDDKVEGMINDG